MRCDDPMGTQLCLFLNNERDKRCRINERKNFI